MAIEEVAGHKGIAGRAVFVIGPDREVRYAWYAPDLGTLPEPAGALEAAGQA